MAKMFNEQTINNVATATTAIKSARLASAKPTKPAKASAMVDANVKMSVKNQILMFESIRDGKEAGISIQEAIEKTATNFPDKKAAKIITALYHYVMNGDPLFEAMARFPNAFPTFLCSLMEAAQISGKWTSTKKDGEVEPGILDMLISFLKRSDKARSKLMMGMLYPAILLLLTVAAIGVLAFSVLPTIKDMFVALNVFNSMNPLSRGLFNFGEWVTENYHLIPVAIITLIVGAKLFWDMAGSKLWQYYQLRIKLIDKVFINFALAESLLLLATLYKAGLPILQSLDIVTNACRNPEIGGAFELSRVYIETEGELLSDALKRAHFAFEGDPHFRISRGEQTGNLDVVLISYSHQLFEKLDEQIDVLIKMLEPAVIVVGGIVIGLIAVSFYGALSGAIAGIR